MPNQRYIVENFMFGVHDTEHIRYSLHLSGFEDNNVSISCMGKPDLNI
jgi:hypothetical protein